MGWREEVERRFHGGCPGNLAQQDDQPAPNDHQCTFPSVEIRMLDRQSFVLRVSKCVHYEGNFLFVLLGSDRCMVHDTGPVNGIHLRCIVDRLIEFSLEHRHHEEESLANLFAKRLDSGWFSSPGSDCGFPLMVVHSHCHGDHIQGDEEFVDRPNTQILPHSLLALKEFFQISPNCTHTCFDLGERRVEVLFTAGHEPQGTDVCFYDHSRAWMLTGDIFYPGRLYISNFTAFRQSMLRLNQFVKANGVSVFLGSHIEIGQPTGTSTEEYPTGTRYQPNEHRWALYEEDLAKLCEWVENFTEQLSSPVRFPSFILVPV